MDEGQSRKMTMLALSGSISELAKVWAAFQRDIGLRVIRNDAHYERVVEIADALADLVEDESHELYSMYELALELIEHWENEHVQIPDAEPREVLRFLIEQNNLKQKDLVEIASQTLISDILAGRRDISKRLAKLLADRFNVEVAAFL